jgi:hypothetical protein
LVWQRLPGWCARAPPSPYRVLASPVQRRAVAGSCCQLSAQYAAFPRLRRSPTCKWGLCLRGRPPSRGGGDRSPPAADASGFLSWGFKDAPPSISARCVRSRRGRLATIPAFGQGDATLPGAFRPCRSSRLRRFAPLRASQGPRLWGPGSARAESAPIGVSPATDPGVHAVSAPAACPRSLDPSGCLSAPGPQESGGRELRVQVRPRSCPTLRSVPLVSSRPVVTDGRYLLAVAGRCAGRRRGCEPRRRLRWRLPASRPCSAAEVRVQKRCCQRSCPDAPLGLVLKRAGGRCFRGS